MKLSQILQIEHILSGRKTPSDILDQDEFYYSESLNQKIKLLDMELTHIIRAFLKLKEENKELYEEQIDLNQALLDEVDSRQLPETLANYGIAGQQKQIDSINKIIKNLDDEHRLLVDLFHDDQFAEYENKKLLNKIKKKDENG